MFTKRQEAEAVHNVHTPVIVPGAYRTTMFVNGPARRDKTEAERQAEREADRITYGELLQSNGWTRADFETAKEYGFPAQISFYSAGPSRGQGIYSRTAIDAWREKLLKLAATLKAR